MKTYENLTSWGKLSPALRDMIVVIKVDLKEVGSMSMERKKVEFLKDKKHQGVVAVLIFRLPALTHIGPSGSLI